MAQRIGRLQTDVDAGGCACGHTHRFPSLTPFHWPSSPFSPNIGILVSSQAICRKRLIAGSSTLQSCNLLWFTKDSLK
eukprot:scaffold25576_cov15-Prasinocladus_malaysianus.AAC.2